MVDAKEKIKHQIEKEKKLNELIDRHQEFTSMLLDEFINFFKKMVSYIEFYKDTFLKILES